WERLRRLLQGVAPLWAPISLLLIVGLALLNLLLWQRLSRLEKMAAGPEMHIVALVGTEAAPDAHGIVVISGDGEYGSLIVEKLPPLSPEKQYQLWLIQNGQRTSGGVFSVTPEGYGVMEISSPRPLLEYSAFGITIEPAGGSPGPTGAKVLGGSL
ncbi:MAG: anti-sigma factor, partial [Chloroflexi bacterium]